MEKSFFIALAFIVMIVALAALGSHRSDEVQKPINTTTAMTATNSIVIVLTNGTRTVTSTTVTESSTASQHNGNKTMALNYSEIFTSFVLSENQTGSYNTSVLMTTNGTYYIVLHGLFNYPTAFFTSNSTMVLMIEAEVVFTNGSTGNLYIPVFQIVKFNSTKSVPFSLVLYGNSPILAQDYSILKTLENSGIYSINVMYITEEGYTIEGVIYI